ncbi:MAG: hypothetical protein K0S47_2103 [Herbinix sp.]|jgi:hypothetical protein|nr:hypothetical protein [Herbinix sp.]
MNKSTLKQALYDAELFDLEKLPSEDELKSLYSFSEEFQESMVKILSMGKKKERRYFYIGDYTIRKAVAAVAVLLLTFSLSMTVEAVRKPFVTMLLKIYEKFTDIYYDIEEEHKEQLPTVIEQYYTPSYIPKGYALGREDKTIPEIYSLVFERDTGDMPLLYDQYIISGANQMIDSEDTSVEHIIIKGEEGLFFQKNHTSFLMWTDGSYSYSLIGPFDFDTMKKIAESLR